MLHLRYKKLINFSWSMRITVFVSDSGVEPARLVHDQIDCLTVAVVAELSRIEGLGLKLQ